MTKQSGWQASLDLKFTFEDGRTVLRDKRHAGPLVIQKTLYPEGNQTCHAIIVHPPGGILEGDKLEINAQLAPRAHVLFTTPGATRWYKSAGAQAWQRVHIQAGAYACVEWLPQETIYFEHTHAKNLVDIALAADSRFIGWEIACLGRRLAGEAFLAGRVQQRLRVSVDGKPMFIEQGALAASDAALTSSVGFGGNAAFATFVAYAEGLSPALLEQCRQSAVPPDFKVGLTLMGKVLVGRAMGNSPEAIRAIFTAWWKIIRETVCLRVAVEPRIWQT